MIRESIGSALLSSHLETQVHESSIDRIGALSRATALGSALWRWGYAGDASSLGSALKHLLRKAQRRVKVYKGHKDFALLLNTCKMVLYEWRFHNCESCGGGGEVESDFDLTGKSTKVKCHVCTGTGKKRYSDGERMAHLNIEPHLYRKWEKQISEVWICLAGSDGGTGAICREQLERI